MTPNQEDQPVLDFLGDWPDGTPKSFGNAFTEHWDFTNSDLDYMAYRAARNAEARERTKRISREKLESESNE